MFLLCEAIFTNSDVLTSPGCIVVIVVLTVIKNEKQNYEWGHHFDMHSCKQGEENVKLLSAKTFRWLNHFVVLSSIVTVDITDVQTRRFLCFGHGLFQHRHEECFVYELNLFLLIIYLGATGVICFHLNVRSFVSLLYTCYYSMHFYLSFLMKYQYESCLLLNFMCLISNTFSTCMNISDNHNHIIKNSITQEFLNKYMYCGPTEFLLKLKPVGPRNSQHWKPTNITASQYFNLFRILVTISQKAETQESVERKTSIQYDTEPAEHNPLFQIVSRCSVYKRFYFSGKGLSCF